MLFDARAWFLLLTPTLLLAGCFISAEEHARRLDPDGDGLQWPKDCDNTTPEIGGEEIPYDGLDNDCDPETLDDDLDEDGLPITMDCDDLDPTQGGDEVCDGRDNDCDGLVDDDDPGLEDAGSWYADYDEDGNGDPDSMVRSCTNPNGYVTNLDDCDDTDSDIRVGAMEICGDGTDQDCDNEIDATGEQCENDAPCTQGQACTQQGGDSFCGCDCPDQGYIGWLIDFACQGKSCAMNHAPITFGTTTISCPTEMVDSLEKLSTSSEIVITINCDERDIKLLVDWHDNFLTYGAGADEEMFAQVYNSSSDTKDILTIEFTDALLTEIDAPYLDIDAGLCGGMAKLTFQYKRVYSW